jgi:hypothetical protein
MRVTAMQSSHDFDGAGTPVCCWDRTTGATNRDGASTAPIHSEQLARHGFPVRDVDDYLHELEAQGYRTAPPTT